MRTTRLAGLAVVLFAGLGLLPARGDQAGRPLDPPAGGSPKPAQEMLDAARRTAQLEKKTILVLFGASW